MDLTETFWAGFYTFTGGFVLAVLALAYKSKCSTVNLCWGGLVINRAVEVELKEDLRQVEFKDPQN